MYMRFNMTEKKYEITIKTPDDEKIVQLTFPDTKKDQSLLKELLYVYSFLTNTNIDIAQVLQFIEYNQYIDIDKNLQNIINKLNDENKDQHYPFNKFKVFSIANAKEDIKWE